MRGKKCKALRKAARLQLGRPIRLRALVVERHENGLVSYLPSEWRRLKALVKKG